MWAVVFVVGGKASGCDTIGGDGLPRNRRNEKMPADSIASRRIQLLRTHSPYFLLHDELIPPRTSAPALFMNFDKGPILSHPLLLRVAVDFTFRSTTRARRKQYNFYISYKG